MRPKVPKKRKNHRRIISERHLSLIRQLPCILSGRPAEAAHISYGDLKYSKPHNAMGIKADDKYVVPLCPVLHRLSNDCQHDSGEREWWQQFDIDPVNIALRLWWCNHSLPSMEKVVDEIRLEPDARLRVLEILKGERP